MTGFQPRGCIAFLALVVSLVGCSPTAPTSTELIRLSAAGESCARTADCSGTLICIDNYCASGPKLVMDSDGGVVAAPGPRLGGRGESCLVVSDCRSDLTCRPTSLVSTGVCDYAEYPFQPTGKACIGECNTPADCCELPVVPGGYLGFSSCEDLSKKILDALGGTTVAGACTNPGAQEAPCFAYATYCNCAANTWACTQNKCVYSAACQFSGVTTKGCPAITRVGTALVTNCDTAAGKCQPTAGPPQCSSPANCNNLPIRDIPGDVCNTGECTCYQGGCYRRCTKEIDCAQGFSCDTTTSMCVPAGQCSTNEQCAEQLHNVAAECRNKTCVLTCKADFECSGSGLLSPFNDSVCNAEGVCENLGCSSDFECSAAGGVKTFCVTKPAGGTVVAPRSAITDGR